MNERIKKLAEQAGFVLWKDEAYNPGDVIDWGSSYDGELVNYTELLIQEVLDVLYDVEDSYFDHAGMASVAKQCRVEVAKHFGVRWRKS